MPIKRAAERKMSEEVAENGFLLFLKDNAPVYKAGKLMDVWNDL